MDIHQHYQSHLAGALESSFARSLLRSHSPLMHEAQLDMWTSSCTHSGYLSLRKPDSESSCLCFITRQRRPADGNVTQRAWMNPAGAPLKRLLSDMFLMLSGRRCFLTSCLHKSGFRLADWRLKVDCLVLITICTQCKGCENKIKWKEIKWWHQFCHFIFSLIIPLPPVFLCLSFQVTIFHL